MKKSNLELKVIFTIFSLTIFLLSACGVENARYQKEWYEMETTNIKIEANDQAKPVLTRNFYFIFDGSGSMNDQPDKQPRGDQHFSTKMSGAKWAVHKFLDQVPPEVNIGLYVFDIEGQRELLPLQRGNREAFRKAIDEMSAGGETPLAEAIAFGAQRLKEKYQEQLGYGEFRLVVVTDGLASSLPKAAIDAARLGFPIYTIGLSIKEKHPLRDFSVSYKAAENFEELAQGLEDTLAELPDFDPMEFTEEELNIK